MTQEELLTRIEKLEEHSAFQGQAIADLSEALNDQWKLLEAFKRDVKRLTDEIKAVEDNLSQGDQREPPPPHY